MSAVASEPIAVVGMGCVYPGAPTVEALWEQAVGEHGAIADADETVARVLSRRAPQQSARWRGGYAARAWRPEALPQPVPAKELEVVNRMQFLALDAATQALSAVRVLPRDNTAVILGACGLGLQKDSGLRVRLEQMLDALRVSPSFLTLGDDSCAGIVEAMRLTLDRQLKASNGDNVIGSLGSVAAWRIAASHQLKGPHYCVDADHASALAALEVAISGLRQGEWECVVTGGVSELLTATQLVAYEHAGWLAGEKEARPFCSTSAGARLGEGAGIVVLKRLSSAQADGDDILAVVSRVGSERAGDDAMAVSAAVRTLSARTDGQRLGHVECDAAGVIGVDLTLARGLREALGTASGVTVGSSAGLHGHTRAAQGAAALLRAVLSVRHGRGPHVGTPDMLNALGPPEQPRPLTSAGALALTLRGQCFHALIESAPIESGAEATAAHSTSPQHRSAARRGAAAPFAPLAIVGMGGVYADTSDLDSFWGHLCAGRDWVKPVPDTRWRLVDHHTDDVTDKNRSYATRGSFVEPAACGHVIADAVRAHPQQDPAAALLTFALHQALGGDVRLAPKRTHVFAANMPVSGRRFLAEAAVNHGEFAHELDGHLAAAGLNEAQRTAIVEEATARFLAALPSLSSQSLSGWSPSCISAELASSLGETVGAVAIESACASVLAAVHAAALALHDRRCDTAVVAGFFADLSPEFYVATCRFKGLSREGIAPFSANAAGFIPGEGVGLFVLQRLSDVEKASTPVRAIIQSVAGSTCTQAGSVLRPTVEGEALALKRALHRGRIDPESVEYVECHGTGTPIGDAVEATALSQVYGQPSGRALKVGSVKSNLGHLCGAAGAPALTKAVFALTHGLIPASLHCEPLSTEIAAVSTLEVVSTAKAWPALASRPRRAGVSSFGIGGTNFHLIVEQPPAQTPTAPTSQEKPS